MKTSPPGPVPAAPIALRGVDTVAARSAEDDLFPPLSLPDLFLSAVAAAPDAPLLDFLGRTYSYAQVATQARAFAAGLQRRGLGPGARIGIFLPNLPLYLATYYGALIVGATVVNYASMWDGPQLSRAIAQTAPDVIVASDLKALAPALAEARAAAPDAAVVIVRLAPQLPRLAGLAARLARLSVRVPGVRWHDFLSSEAPRPVAIDPLRDVAVIQYTSGTTGPPRAVRLSHQNLTANARQLEAIDPWHGSRDVMIGVMPLAGAYGNSAVLNRTVLDHGCIALLARFEPRQVLKTIARTRATTMPGIPTMFQALLDDPALTRTDLSSLRACISGGAPMSAPLRQRFEAASRAKVVEGYGLTEATGVVSINPFAEPAHAGTAGRALPATRWTVLDTEDPARPVPAGEPGELAVAGPQVMLGHWDDPAADAAAFAGEWLRTGDYATIDAEGFATVVDRRADVMNVAGERVFPSLVEDVLVTHDAVREAVVIGIPDPFRGEGPKAFVTLREDSLDTGESLRNWVNGRLPAKHRVLTVEVRETLPRVAVGKLDRKALRAEEAARTTDLKLRS